MSDYKLVPVEITDEMAEASGCEGCFRKSVHDQAQDMWTAMLAAAPAVQGEPVAYASFAENGNIQIWCSDPIQAETLRHQYGDRIKPLYAAPQPAEQQPAPDVDVLVDALEDIGASWHGVNTELERYMRNVARLALTAYSKGARNEDD